MRANTNVQAKRSFNQYNTRPDEVINTRDSNTFDKSHDVKTTGSMGQLIPILIEEALPGDSFEMSSEAMFRFAPLNLPIMHRCIMTLHYFYITWRVLWPNWQKFITRKEDVEWPWYFQPMTESPTGVQSNDYYTAGYMGFPTTLTSDPNNRISYPISAGPISAYLKVYDEYYRNPQMQEEKWFELQDGDNTDLFIIPDPVNDFTRVHVLRKLWNRDYFTAALPTPQLGEDSLIPMYNPDWQSEFDTEFNGDTLRGPWQWLEADLHTPVEETNQLYNVEEVTPELNRTTVGGAAGTPVYLDTQTGAATVRQLRLAVMRQAFMEKLLRTGQRYRDFLKGWWQVDPDPLALDLPVFIGGITGNVVISEVLATAETVVGESIATPLGAYAGQALMIEQGKRFKYYCRDYGFIMGIVCVTPRTSYFQGLGRMWKRSTPDDYPWQEFAHIGDQAILRREIQLYAVEPVGPTTNDDINDVEWAYIPRYDEYRWSNDIVSGQMRKLWISFHMGRLLSESLQGPLFNNFFVECFPRITDVFQIAAAQDHEIYMHIFNNVKVSRKLPRFGIPKL